MDINTKSGFTIIEVILFFGVAGLLTLAILAGSGASVAQQRYRDSVHTLRSVIQDQYSEVASVINDRPNNQACSTEGVISESSAGADPRGTSRNCIMIGRFIQSYKSDSDRPDGESLHTYPVVAAMSGDPDSSIMSDTEAISQYNLSLDTDRYDEKRIEWDNSVRVADLSGSAANQFSMLIVRSPLSGSILTYIATGGAASSPQAMVTTANLQNELTACVDPAANEIILGERMAVRVAANASNQSGVEMISEQAGNGC